MSRAVVYYSLYGNTKYIGESLARHTGAQAVELREEGSRKGVLGFVRSGFQAKTKKRSALVGEPWNRIADCDTVFLVTPIWASSGTPAMNAFLDHADFAGKTVHIVTVQADPKGAGSEKVHNSIAERVQSRGGTVEKRHSLTGSAPGKYAGDQVLDEQISRIL